MHSSPTTVTLFSHVTQSTQEKKTTNKQTRCYSSFCTQSAVQGDVDAAVRTPLKNIGSYNFRFLALAE